MSNENKFPLNIIVMSIKGVAPRDGSPALGPVATYVSLSLYTLFYSIFNILLSPGRGNPAA